MCLNISLKCAFPQKSLTPNSLLQGDPASKNSCQSSNDRALNSTQAKSGFNSKFHNRTVRTHNPKIQDTQTGIQGHP